MVPLFLYFELAGGTWCAARYFFEDAFEMRDAVKADLAADLRDGLVRGEQHLLGLDDAYGVEVLDDGRIR